MPRLLGSAGRVHLASVLVAILASAAFGGCGRSGGGAGGAMPRFHQPIVARLKRDGFAVRNVATAPADPFDALQCVRGEVERIEVLLCEYHSPEDARSAEKKLAHFAEGAVSGAARSSGAVGMAIADKQKADVKGKRIVRLLKAFTGKDAAAAESLLQPREERSEQHPRGTHEERAGNPHERPALDGVRRLATDKASDQQQIQKPG